LTPSLVPVAFLEFSSVADGSVFLENQSLNILGTSVLNKLLIKFLALLNLLVFWASGCDGLVGPCSATGVAAWGCTTGGVCSDGWGCATGGAAWASICAFCWGTDVGCADDAIGFIGGLNSGMLNVASVCDGLLANRPEDDGYQGILTSGDGNCLINSFSVMLMHHGVHNEDQKTT